MAFWKSFWGTGSLPWKTLWATEPTIPMSTGGMLAMKAGGKEAREGLDMSTSRLADPSVSCSLDEHR